MPLAILVLSYLSLPLGVVAVSSAAAARSRGGGAYLGELALGLGAFCGILVVNTATSTAEGLFGQRDARFVFLALGLTIAAYAVLSSAILEFARSLAGSGAGPRRWPVAAFAILVWCAASFAVLEPAGDGGASVGSLGAGFAVASVLPAAAAWLAFLRLASKRGAILLPRAGVLGALGSIAFVSTASILNDLAPLLAGGGGSVPLSPFVFPPVAVAAIAHCRSIGRTREDVRPQGAEAPDGEAAAIGAFAAAAGLSERETELLPLLLAGNSNDEIGRKLFISVNTVKNHVRNLYAKTGARNRLQLAGMVRRGRP